MYNHKKLLQNYITNLESIADNQNKKICYPFLYKLKNNKTKLLWLIYDEDMKKNISNYEVNDKLAISQYFMDITYNCVPKSKYIYKLLIIIGFDNNLYKSVICCFSLIIDGLTTTLNFLFNILKTEMGFNPKIINTDFQQSLRKSIKLIFPECNIYPCYYHFTKSIRYHLLKYYIKKKKI